MPLGLPAWQTVAGFDTGCSSDSKSHIPVCQTHLGNERHRAALNCIRLERTVRRFLALPLAFGLPGAHEGGDDLRGISAVGALREIDGSEFLLIFQQRICTRFEQQFDC